MTGLANGYSTAVAHGNAQWLSTSRYVFERLESIGRASEHMRDLALHCEEREPFLLLAGLLEETAGSLQKEMPPELPFLENTPGMPRRLRIAAVMREWLLMSHHPREREHLQAFLLGYQNVAPLCLAEIQLMPVALRLAVIEKCRLLPSAENATHREILPRLLQRLATTCQFISGTNWNHITDAVSPESISNLKSKI